MSEKKSVLVRISKQIHGKLRTFAFKKKRSMTDVVSEAVESHITKESNGQK